MRYLILLMVALTYGSELSDLAGSMEPGDWVVLETTGYTLDYLDAGPADYAINYGNSGVWDPVHGIMRFKGRGHNGYAKHLIYTESTNTWTLGDTTETMAHGYDHNAIDPATGDFYHYIARKIMAVLPYGSNTWVNLTQNNLSSQTYWEGNLAQGVAFYPEANAIYMQKQQSIYRMDVGATSWTRLILNGDYPYGSNHNVMEYNPVKKHLIFGGGNGEGRLSYIDTTCTGLGNCSYKNILAAPVSIQSQFNTLIVEPVTGNLLLKEDSWFWKYTYNDSTWTTLDPAPNDPYGMGVTTPISSYGVVMHINLNGVYLYKHDTGGVIITPPEPEPDTCLSSIDTLLVTDTLTATDTLWMTDTIPVLPDSIIINGTTWKPTE